MQEDQRQPVLIAIHDEPGRLLGAIDIEHSAELQRAIRRPHAMMLIGHNSDRETAEPSGAADDRLAELGLVFVEGSRIDEAIEHRADFIFVARITAHQLV